MGGGAPSPRPSPVKGEGVFEFQPNGMPGLIPLKSGSSTGIQALGREKTVLSRRIG